jgi:hypothetical protein
VTFFDCIHETIANRYPGSHENVNNCQMTILASFVERSLALQLESGTRFFILVKTGCHECLYNRGMTCPRSNGQSCFIAVSSSTARKKEFHNRPVSIPCSTTQWS